MNTTNTINIYVNISNVLMNIIINITKLALNILFVVVLITIKMYYFDLWQELQFNYASNF